MKRGYIGGKCNENAIFLFKNTRNKEKDPFLFEKWYFLLCLVIALISQIKPWIKYIERN